MANDVIEAGKKYHEAIMKYMRPRTVPIGITLLDKADDIPEGAFSMVDETGIEPGICQIVAHARWEEKISVAIRPEICCGPGMLLCGMGMIAPPGRPGKEPGELFTPGQVGIYTEDFEKGMIFEREGASLGSIFGKNYQAMVAGPIYKMPIEPMVVLQYANPAQIRKLILAYLYKTGHTTRMNSTGRAGLCLESIAAPITEKKPRLAIPGVDRNYGLVQDDEMIFSTPWNLMETIYEGLEAQSGIEMLKYPISPGSLQLGGASYAQLNIGNVHMAGKTWQAVKDGYDERFKDEKEARKKKRLKE